MQEMASGSLSSDALIGMKLGIACVATCGLTIIEVTNRRSTPAPVCVLVNFPLSMLVMSWECPLDLGLCRRSSKSVNQSTNSATRKVGLFGPSLPSMATQISKKRKVKQPPALGRSHGIRLFLLVEMVTSSADCFTVVLGAVRRGRRLLCRAERAPQQGVG